MITRTGSRRWTRPAGSPPRGPARVAAFLVALAGTLAGACDEGLDAVPNDGDTAALTATREVGRALRAAPPEGYAFALNGTHPVDCTDQAQCATMLAELPAPNTCGGSGGPTAAFILHQRGTDWNGAEGEDELGGEAYATALGTTTHDQSVIVQCCPADPTRPGNQGAFFAVKTCPDPCGEPGALCPSTCGSTAFGNCRGCSATLIPTAKCSLALVDAGWKDPHAPHDLWQPSGDDKPVWDVYYRAAWTCGDGVCDPDETCSTCAADCCPP